MFANFVIVPELRLVVSSPVGTLTPEDIEHGRDRLRSDPDFDPTFSHLIDLRRVVAVEVAAAGVRRIAGATTFAEGTHQAIVASSDLTFGLARMYENLPGPLSQQVAVFRTPTEALAWLGVAAEELARHFDVDAKLGGSD